MRVPERLAALIGDGVITEVIRPLKSGKEAEVYLVASGTDLGVAKLYKESTERSFKHRADYTEGRGTRNTRDTRAMKRGSRYGRSVTESAWRSTEADVIHTLLAAGVHVPQPYAFQDGVLIMELVTDAEGHPAPRLGEVELDPEIAPLFFEVLMQDVVRMTHAGVVHGDLSEFNVLVGAEGPVLIDFPQAVDVAKSPHAKKLLLRDVENVVRFGARYDPRLKDRPFGPELWDLLERAALRPDTKLTGRFQKKGGRADADGVLREIRDVERERARELARREGSGGSGRRPVARGGESSGPGEPTSRPRGRARGRGRSRGRPSR